jgi:CheY-like chemotaxis protein
MNSILIVDDTAFTRLVLRNMFEKLGIEVVAEADSGEVAPQLHDATLSLKRSRQVHVILSQSPYSSRELNGLFNICWKQILGETK